MERKSESFSKFVVEALRLAIPVSLQRVTSTVVNLIDNIMVGKLGDVSVAACSLGGQYNLLFTLISGGVVNGALVIAAQAWGTKNKDNIKRLISLATYLSLVISLLFFLISQFFNLQIVQIYTDKQFLYEETANYISLISYSFIPMALTTCYTMILRTTGSVKLGFIVETVNSVVNAVLNYCLIFGNFGFPKLGLTGAAIATVVSRTVGLVITLVYTYVFEKNLAYRLSDLRKLPDKELIHLYIKTGIPILISDIFMTINSTLQSMIVGRISDTYLTANSIVHTVWQTAMMVSFGFEAAASIMIGNIIGEGDTVRAQSMAEQFFKLSLIQGVICALLVKFGGPLVLSHYEISEAAMITTKKMMNSAVLVVFVMCIQTILTRGAIRAGGKSKEVMIVEILSTLGFGIPLGYIAAKVIGLPEEIVYIIIRGDYWFKAVWGIYKLKKKNWISILVK